MNAPFDLKSVRDQITALMVAYPELADDEVLREDMLEGSTNAKEFLSQITRKVGSTAALLNGTIGYMKELQERVVRLQRREYALRELIHKVMDTAELRKIELAEATLSIRNTGPKVIITNEHEIPDEFMRIRKEPNKTAIKASLQAGTFVPGTELSNGQQTLAILTK